MSACSEHRRDQRREFFGRFVHRPDVAPRHECYGPAIAVCHFVLVSSANDVRCWSRGSRVYSFFMPVARTILAYFSVCSTRYFMKSSGVLPTGSAASSLRRVCTSSALSIRSDRLVQRRHGRLGRVARSEQTVAGTEFVILESAFLHRRQVRQDRALDACPSRRALAACRRARARAH